jgi:hypothetical protein
MAQRQNAIVAVRLCQTSCLSHSWPSKNVNDFSECSFPDFELKTPDSSHVLPSVDAEQSGLRHSTCKRVSALMICDSQHHPQRSSALFDPCAHDRSHQTALLPAQTGGVTANFSRSRGAGGGRAKTSLAGADASALDQFLQNPKVPSHPATRLPKPRKKDGGTEAGGEGSEPSEFLIESKNIGFSQCSKAG